MAEEKRHASAIYAGLDETEKMPVADAARDVCYHRACDTVASVDTPEVRSRLLVIADASLQGLRTLLGEVQG